MSLRLFADIIAANPAERFNLSSKGNIAIGKDADLVLIKPNAPYTLTTEDLEYKNKISPYVGREIGAQVARTILRGETVYSLEDGVSDTRSGEFVFVK